MSGSEIGRQLNLSKSCVNEMKLENWIGRHVHAYNYLGGVTHMLVPDNLKTGIMKKPL